MWYISIVHQLDTSVSQICLFWINTLHVSDGLSIHQEFKTVHTATGICQAGSSTCLTYYYIFDYIYLNVLVFVRLLIIKHKLIQCVPLATKPGISLIILTSMKILQRNLTRGMFVVWEMKRNVSVVCVCSAPNILISGKITKEMLGSVVSGTHCIMV
jgi:hypothetical protein